MCVVKPNWLLKERIWDEGSLEDKVLFEIINWVFKYKCFYTLRGLYN